MKVLHVVPGLDVIGNGISVAAKLIAGEQNADLIEARHFAGGKGDISQFDEVWVHSAWLPTVLLSCGRVLKAGKRLVRMSHANYDPVRLAYHSWKKRLLSPIDRHYLQKADKIVATCDAEADWIRSYLGHHCPPIIITDIKRFFKLVSGGVESGGVCSTNSQLTTHNSQLHLLYLGRRHPLKGLSYLESALATYYNMLSQPTPLDLPPEAPDTTYYNKCPIEFRAVSNASGDELEKVWDWCDVLILPTLSDNFGLVIAEALERGKRVITTDGAPAWNDGNDYGGRLIYIKGYRDGSPAERVRLLKDAIERLCK